MKNYKFTNLIQDTANFNIKKQTNLHFAIKKSKNLLHLKSCLDQLHISLPSVLIFCTE